MPVDEKEYKRLRQEVDFAKEEADRAQGSVDTLMDRLERDYGCDSLKDAKKKLDKLKEEAKQAEEEFEKEMKLYRKKWRAEQQEERDDD